MFWAQMTTRVVNCVISKRHVCSRALRLAGVTLIVVVGSLFMVTPGVSVTLAWLSGTMETLMLARNLGACKQTIVKS
jgi:hypothetical protein